MMRAAACALAVLAPLLGALPARADISSAQRAYENVLRTMLSLPEPAQLSYTADILTRNGSFLIGRDGSSGEAEFGFEIGGDPQPLRLRVTQRAAAPDVVLGLDPAAMTQHPLLDASWRGSYDWLRYGFDGPPPVLATPTPLPTALASPLDDVSATPVVAVVRAIGTASYSIEDRGPQRCPDGHAGYHVRLHARRDPDAHPATDAVFDVATQHMCMLRFALRPSQFLGVPGSVEVDYGRVGAYVLATQAQIEFWGTIRHVGRNHLEILVRYSDFAT